MFAFFHPVFDKIPIIYYWDYSMNDFLHVEEVFDCVPPMYQFDSSVLFSFVEKNAWREVV